MLVRLVGLVHFCAPYYVAVKMANCVKIKMNEKVMRLKSSTLTVGNLAMIFKLDMDQGIYICCEEEGEIIIPTETGVFNVEDYSKTYVVNGEPTRPPPREALPNFFRRVIRLESPSRIKAQRH